MRVRSILLVVAVLAVIALPPSASAQSASPARSATAAGASSVPRTPWGDPDLQGDWTSQGELGVPFERAKEFGTRPELSDEEFAKAADRLRTERDRDNAERGRALLRGDRSVRSKKILKIIFCGVEGEISHKQFRAHDVFLLRMTALSRLFPIIGFQIIIESRSTEDFPCLEID